MTPREITYKRRERLEKERANHVAGLERLRKGKKAEYLLKLGERRMEKAKKRAPLGKKGAIERETKAYSYSFKSITRPELLEKRRMYERMKKIAEGKSNELLVYHCEDMLREINKWLKERK